MNPTQASRRHICAIYCRVSTPGQKNTTSLPEQERLCREHAAERGWEVSEAHVYREVEGGEDLYRPQMDRLWDAIAAHELNGVVIDVLDRLSRDEGDQGAFYHHCDRHGVTIELASEDLDESDHGRNLRTLAGIMARMERVDIRRRTQRGRRAHVAAGKMLVGACPLYGYLWGDPEKGARTYYVEDPETAWVVRRIFEAVANGMPLRQLARELEQAGVPSPGQRLAEAGQWPAGRSYSSLWRGGTLRRILWHPAYWGAHSAYRWHHSTVKIRPPETGVTQKVRRTVERAEDDPARVALPATACPPLVSRELAERAHARLAVTKAENVGRNPDPLATIWRGMAYCGHCGQRMFTGAHHQGRHYKCRTWRANNGTTPVACPGRGPSIAASTLDPAGWADVRAWLSDPANVARLLADWEQEDRSTRDSMTSRLAAADAHLAVLRDKMGRLADGIAETSDRESRLVLQQKLDEYAERVRAEESKRARLLDEAREAADYAEAARDVREWVRAVAAGAPSFTPAEQWATLKALGAQVTVWREDYVHPDGDPWPQRYRIVLHFTGFTGQPVILPPSPSGPTSAHPDSHYTLVGQIPPA